MIEKEELTDLLKLGGIRLIPKNGELENISNWRPISLLSVVYKLFSGALTKRLETVMEKISSKSQKGYSRKKRLHDSIINILELINICSMEQINMICVAIDFRKAFDSVNFDFMFNCLDFFNFGTRFKKMIKTCLKNRCACIITDEGFTPNFKIEQGVPQGDRLSPYLFIIAIELLLIKIEYNPNIERLIIPGLPNCSKLEGFADDITALLKASVANIQILNDILNDFGAISGLKFSKQ